MAVAAGIVVVPSLQTSPESFHRVAGTIASVYTGYPTSDPAASPTPLGAPQAPPEGEGGYAILQTQDRGRGPVGWDPCRPLRVVYNPAQGPENGEQLLRETIKRIQEVTGQRISYLGTTDEVWQVGRPNVQKSKYGAGWAPVLVSWSNENADKRLDGRVAAFTSTQSVSGVFGGRRRYVTGSIVLDAPQIQTMQSGPGGHATVRAVMLHEWGHLIGLDHVDDPRQLMYPSTSRQRRDFAEGDLRGLIAVSGRPCYSDW